MAIEKKTGLGKGLGALIEMVETTQNQGVVEIDINDIEPTINQPRKYFDDDKINELAESIKKHGIIQPLIVSKEGEIYKIIAGERRWRASKKAGLKIVPVVIREVTPAEHMELAIIENIQREDLNPLEEAEAYERLSKDYKMTQDEVAESVGKSRPAISNAVRLLSLSDYVKSLIVCGTLSAGHAKCMVTVKGEEAQKKAADTIIALSLNVRQTENYIKKLTEKEGINSKEKAKNNDIDNPDNKKNIEIKHIENKLRNIFNTKIKIKDEDNKGKIEIEYYSADERERVLEILQNVSRGTI